MDLWYTNGISNEFLTSCQGSLLSGGLEEVRLISESLEQPQSFGKGLACRWGKKHTVCIGSRSRDRTEQKALKYEGAFGKLETGGPLRNKQSRMRPKKRHHCPCPPLRTWLSLIEELVTLSANSPQFQVSPRQGGVYPFRSSSGCWLSSPSCRTKQSFFALRHPVYQ